MPEPMPSWDFQKQVESEDRMREAIHDAYISIATSSLDRMLRRADTVLRVAGVAGTIYTAILGLAFTYAKASFTVWVLLPAILLALSLVLGATYVGYVKVTPLTFHPLASGLTENVQHKRLSDLIGWVNSVSLRRAWALRSSIAALGIGVASMPIAFLDEHQKTTGIITLVVSAVWVLMEFRLATKGTD